MLLDRNSYSIVFSQSMGLNITNTSDRARIIAGDILCYVFVKMLMAA